LIDLDKLVRHQYFGRFLTHVREIHENRTPSKFANRLPNTAAILQWQLEALLTRTDFSGLKCRFSSQVIADRLPITDANLQRRSEGH